MEDKMRNKVGGAECGGEETEYKLLATKSQGNRLLMKTQHNIKMDLTFRGPCIMIYSYNESQQDALFLKFI
jgi:hypothetical protein